MTDDHDLYETDREWMAAWERWAEDREPIGTWLGDGLMLITDLPRALKAIDEKRIKQVEIDQ